MRWLRTHFRAIAGLLAVVVVLVATNASSPMPAVHGDGYYTYLWARTLVYDHDAKFENDYKLCGDPWGLADSPVGKNVNYWNLGPALFWAPILWVDGKVSAARNSPDPRVAAGCGGPLAERAVYGSMVAGALTILIGFLAARKRFGETPALFAAAAIGLLTSLAYYSTMMLSYGHAASSFGGGLFVLVWAGSRENRTTRGWALLGATLGLALLMRSQNAILGLLPFFDWCLEAARLAWRGLRGDARGGARKNARGLGLHVLRGVLFAVAMAVVFSPQLFAWKQMSGKWLTMTQGEHYMRWAFPSPMRSLFSAAAGLYPWNPILYPATLGLFLMLFRRTTRAVAIGLLVLCALDVYVVSCVYDWWGSIGFPGRRYDLFAVPMTIGLAALVRELIELDRRRRGVGVALAASMAFVLGGVGNFGVQFGIAKLMRADLPRESPYHWNETFAFANGPLWKLVGNPLTWPASLPFAIRYGAHPRRWDVVGGPEFFYHDHQTLDRRASMASLDFADVQSWSYLDGTFREPVVVASGHSARMAESGTARILLPLHWPDAGAFVINATALGYGDGAPIKLGMSVNDVDVGTQALEAGTERAVRFALAKGVTRHGTNEVVLRIDGGQVAFHRLEIFDRSPSPADVQKAREAERAALKK